MKIHTLAISGFGPFKETQKIDFDFLSCDGLFMLEGPTGAGKSSIIDAIVWALYGVTAHEGANKTGGGKTSVSQFSKRVRSDYCKAEDETRVILEFSNGGSRYRIQRTPTYFTLKKRGDGETKVNATVRLEYIKPVHEALTRIEEVHVKINEIMQMGVAQFAQLVVLPQGDFATFLHASSESRKEVLQNIFKTFFYENLEDYFDKRKNEIDKLVEARNFDIRHFLKNVADHAIDGQGEIDFPALEAQVLDINEVRITVDRLIQEVCLSLQRDSEQDETLKLELAKRLIPLEGELAILESSLAKIDDRAKKIVELQRLEESQGSIDESIEQVGDRGRVSHLAMALEELLTAQKEVAVALDLIDESLEGWSANEAKARIAELKPEVRSLEKLVIEAGKHEEEAQTLNDRLERALEIESAKKALPVLEKKMALTQKRVNSKAAEVLAYRKGEKEGYAPLVAKLLKAGAACPVCGSLDHPNPLKVKSVFDPDRLSDLQEELSEIKEALAEVRSDVKGKADLAKKKTGPSKDIKAKLLSLVKEGNKRDGQVAKLESLQEELELLEGNLEPISSSERSTLRVATLQARIDKDLSAAGVADIKHLEQLLKIDPEKLRAVIDKHQTRITEINSILNQSDYLSLPDQDEVSLRKSDLKSQIDALKREQTSVVGRVAINEKVNESLDSLSAALIGELDKRDDIIDKGKSFVRLATLSRGKNNLGLTLTNYVLQERLEMILERASIHLRRVSNGKYEFRLQEDRLGRQQKAGLGITIMDYFAGKERPAETLSGGETFYASLALALGLAEVVKADQGGVELGTLFIDEGFGSLSDNTLDEVLDVLEDLRSDDRVIGVISHVEGMKGQIPARLEVRPTSDGPSVVRMAIAGMD